MIACMRVTGWSDAVERPDRVLVDVAQRFSPRVAVTGAQMIAIDLDGLERILGDARAIGEELRRAAADRGLQARVAVAGTRTAAALLTLGRAGLTVVPPGGEAAALAPLPLDVLDDLCRPWPPPEDPGPRLPSRFYRTSPVQELVRPRRRRAPQPLTPNSQSLTPNPQSLTPNPPSLIPLLSTLHRWGLRTLGALAVLPPDELAARLGDQGPLLQAMARGEDASPLVPHEPDERFEETLALEWPIEGLEPLSFVLGRLFEPLAAHLDRRGRAAAGLLVELRLVTRETWVRRLTLPSPLKDPRVLRTLALLDLESNPPPAGIDAVTVRAEPAPGRTVQYSLLERPRPAPEQVTTLLARLTALMGDRRVGCPALVDTHRPGAFRVAPFTGADAHDDPQAGPPPAGPALRRFRHPVAARVTADQGQPVHLQVSRPGVTGGPVVTCAGPWRTSGDWWVNGEAGMDRWDRDEWDVALEDGTVYRIFRDRRRERWFVDAVID